jgi:hypothetical protein
MRRIRWRTLAAATAGLVCVSAALGGAALASPTAGGVKGNPQPELKPFKISGAGYGGPAGVALEPNGSLVVAYGITSGEGKIVVCLLNRGARTCGHTVTLSPLGGVDMFGDPEVFVTSANHVAVLMDTCCDTNPNGGDLLFSSVNGGRTFAAPVRVGGTVGVDVAELVGDQIVFSSGDDNDGAQVEAIPVDASGPPAEIATANAKVAYDIAVGRYKGGALVASDYLGSDYTTYAEYAPKGTSFDASASYGAVGSFPHEQLVAMSGDALLTQETTGAEALKLRLFNGTKFGAAHVVPGTSGGGPAWFALDQDPGGRVYVFTDRGLAGYDLYERSSATGATWSGAVNLGNAIDSDYFGVGLDTNGSGLVVGSDRGEVTEGYPVLGPQGASLHLKAGVIAKGHTTTAFGAGSPVAKGRPVSLQVERSGLWYTIASTHENGSGAFSFTIKGTVAGTHHYRAVVSDYAGYREYGYSAVRTLKVS